jgi:hypothetical protein
MSTKARALPGLGALLAVGAALFAGAPGASADDALPVPTPPHLISAVVTGCHAPCAIGQSGDVVLTWELSPPPSNDVGVDYREYANDFRLAEVDWGKAGQQHDHDGYSHLRLGLVEALLLPGVC